MISETLQKLFVDRYNKCYEAKEYLDSHTNSAGMIDERHKEVVNAKFKEIDEMDRQIDYEMSQPTSAPILENPGAMMKHSGTYTKMGVSGKEYCKNFFNQIRAGFRNAPYNYLQEASPQYGGYLVPTEFHDEIITRLTDENIFRKLGKTIQTQSEHKIVIQSTKPAAEWFAEGAAINFNAPEFEQKSLSAHKLAVAVKVSNELLQDSFYDVESFLSDEFAKALALKEEDTFINGDGAGKPTGIIPVLASDTAATVTTAGNGISADDLIDLIHSLERPYRKNAAFVMSESTLASIRKMKDATQNYLWQPSLTENEPEKLFGVPVYTSAYMPNAASGNIAVIYGNFASCYTIGQRGQMSLQPLRELFAGNDLTGYLLIERVDALISDTAGIHGLKIK